MMAGTRMVIPAPMTLSALQQVYSRISADAVRITLLKTVLNQGILVQRETHLSLLIIIYSKRGTHIVRSIFGSLRVCMCVNPGML